MTPLLGCIADDFTGATDVASMLHDAGMPTMLLIGVPAEAAAAALAAPEAAAVVIALKSRTAPADEAVAQSLAALSYLRGLGCQHILQKYCSTFDSTEAGNIGPVADALIEALGCGFALACPAFPANGRTVFQGHLFVGTALLNESGMERHPLTPMTDANLVRVLGRQSRGSVGLVPFDIVEQGASAIRDAMTRLKEQGRRYAVVDAVTDTNLRAIGAAAAYHPLLTGGSGIAMGLPDAWRVAGKLPPRQSMPALPIVAGPAAALSGSCSRATLAQVAAARECMPVLELDPLAMPEAEQLAGHARAWLAERLPAGGPVLVSASASPDRVDALQARLGRDAAGLLVERALATIAADMVERNGVRRLVVAGGETSGAVVARLGVRSLQIGTAIDPGVPWTWARRADAAPPLLLALKSGNFGGRDFFASAFERAKGEIA